MSVSSLGRAAGQRIDDWFTAPEPGAAGRMGIFRILFGVFYLWHLSIFDVSILSELPDDFRTDRIMLFDELPVDLTSFHLRLLDSLLVAALVLLVFGLWTRSVTGLVLVLGLLRESVAAGVGVENSNVFLVFYLPLFMLVAGGWGETYSLDATQRARRTGQRVRPSDDRWPYFLAARASLVILVALFCSAPLFKSFAGGTWLSQHDLLANLMLEESIESARLGLPANPLGPWFVDHTAAAFLLQLGILAFEGLFFLALCSRPLRGLFIATALIFHWVNTVYLTVSFTPVLIVYALFVDWEAAVTWLRARVRWRAAVPSQVVLILAPVLSALLAATWRGGSSTVFNLGGRLDWYTMMLPVLPFALGWFGWSAILVARSLGWGRSVEER